MSSVLTHCDDLGKINAIARSDQDNCFVILNGEQATVLWIFAAEPIHGFTEHPDEVLAACLASTHFDTEVAFTAETHRITTRCFPGLISIVGATNSTAGQAPLLARRQPSFQTQPPLVHDASIYRKKFDDS